MKSLIVIPAFNEAENLKTLLPELLSQVSHDVVVVDDASQDETVHVVESFGVKCLSLPLSYPLGYLQVIR